MEWNVFISVSKDTDFCMKPRHYQTVQLSVPLVTEVHIGLKHRPSDIATSIF